MKSSYRARHVGRGALNREPLRLIALIRAEAARPLKVVPKIRLSYSFEGTALFRSRKY